LFGPFLKFAGLVSDAVEAVVGVVGEEEFDDGFSGAEDARGVGFDFHVGCDGVGAAGDEAWGAFDFDDAHAAGTGGRQAFDVAEGGHGDADTFQGGEDGFTGFCLYVLAVYFDVNHVRVLIIGLGSMQFVVFG